MIEVRQSDEFIAWMRKLADRQAAKKIAKRLARLADGLLGDAKFFGGIGELRIDHGPGSGLLRPAGRDGRHSPVRR